MIGRYLGALCRALLVGLVVTLPALLLRDTRPDTAQIAVLFAIFAGVLTLVEYAARYPGLVEFRHAPPYNRVRFSALALTVLLLSLLWRGEVAPTTFTRFVAALGGLLGGALDFPYSPVRLLLLTLPASTPVADVATIRAAAGIALAIAAAAVGFFALALWRTQWPAQNTAFNVWVNLPTFDPTAGGDVVARLERDARANVVLGVLMPFLTPAVLMLAGALIAPISDTGAQTQVWVVAAWAFLPTSLFIRGIALGRIARMIRERREAAAATAGLQPV